MDLKDVFLNGFRSQWKALLRQKFAGNYDALKKANMKELSQEMFGHSAVKSACEMAGVRAEDIEKVLSECRDELLKETH